MFASNKHAHRCRYTATKLLLCPWETAKYCIFVSLCKPVCLFAGISKPHVQTSRNFCVTCGRGAVILWRQCNTLCTSGFVNDVMFSDNGCQWMKTIEAITRHTHNLVLPRRFTIIRQVAAPRCNNVPRGRSLLSLTADCLVSAWQVYTLKHSSHLLLDLRQEDMLTNYTGQCESATRRNFFNSQCWFLVFIEI